MWAHSLEQLAAVSSIGGLGHISQPFRPTVDSNGDTFLRLP